MRFGYWAFAITMSVCLAVPAYAEGVRDCDNALIKGTLESNFKYSKDWRLAIHINEDTYNSVKTDVGATGAIYGVPVGANFNEFRENIASKSSSTDESLSITEIRNVLWTGLDENSSKAYGECIRAVAQRSGGMLALVPIRATATNVTFRVVYTPIGNSPNPLPVRWVGAEEASGTVPDSLTPGEETIIVKRPVMESTLAVNGAGATADILLTPLPAEIPPDLRPNVCSFDSPPANENVLSTGSAATWICPPMRAGTYIVSFFAKPTSQPAGVWFRVTYLVQALIKENQQERAVNLPGTGVLDINVDAGIGQTMSSSGGQFKHSGGSLLIKLVIGGVSNHNDFTNPNAGSVVLPDQMNIEVKGIE